MSGKVYSKVVIFTFEADSPEDADNEDQWIIDKLASNWYPHEAFEHIPVQEGFPQEIILDGKAYKFDGAFTYQENPLGAVREWAARWDQDGHHGIDIARDEEEARIWASSKLNGDGRWEVLHREVLYGPWVRAEEQPS